MVAHIGEVNMDRKYHVCKSFADLHTFLGETKKIEKVHLAYHPGNQFPV